MALRNTTNDKPPEFLEIWIVFGNPTDPQGWRGYRVANEYWRSTPGPDVKVGKIDGWRETTESDPVGSGGTPA